MSRFYANTVTSVANPPLIVIAIAEEQTGWCQQVSFSVYARFLSRVLMQDCS